MKKFFDRLKRNPAKFEKYYYIYVGLIVLVNVVMIVGFFLFLYFLLR